MGSLPVTSFAITTAPGIWPDSTLDLKADSISETMFPPAVAATAWSEGRVVVEAILETDRSSYLLLVGQCDKPKNDGVELSCVCDG